MAIINGTKGTHGTNGATPTIGGPGSNESFTQNGKIGADSLTEQVFGGDGGDGGNGTGAAAGANGGNGGNATNTLNGNIFNAPATNNLTVSLTSIGGNGGLGGTSVNSTPGLPGNGGNATVTMSGNIIQPNKIMNIIELDAIAIAGDGTRKGNASATINGNIIQPSKATGTVTLLAKAYANGADAYANNGNTNYGTKTAIINGNIVQGNVNNVYLNADTYNPSTPFVGSNGTATINGNVIQTNAANTGFVSLEASGQHIAITQNKITLGLQELDLAVNQFGPTYDTQIKTNEFKGTGTNTFTFTDNVYPGPHTPDTIAIDLGAGTFMFNGNSNTLTGFANATVWSNDAATIVGSNAINTLTGGNGDDTISGLGGNDVINGSGGNDLLTGGAGNDTIDGGAGLFDTAVYSGARAQYTLSFINTGNLAGTVTDTVPGRDGTDALTNVEFLKFSDGLYDVVNGTFSTNNHAPVAVADTYSVLEDNVLTVPALTGVLANDTDADSDPLTSVLVTNAANGNVVLNANGSFTYTPNANFNGADSFTYKANDGISDSAPVTVTLNVTSVNDAPSGADKLITTLEDTSYTFTASDFGFTDPNDSPANALLAVKIATLPAAGILLDNGVPVTPGQSVSAADIAGGLLTFAPAANANGAGYANFTFQVQDNGGTANGGIDLDASPNTITFNVTSVNDAPSGADDIVTTLQNTPYTFAASDFGFTDPNDTPANALLAVKISTLPAAGTLTDNGVPVTAGQFVSLTDIAGGLLKFTPAINGSGTGYASFTFQVQDNGGTANGGVDLDQSPNSMTINVTPVGLFVGPGGYATINAAIAAANPGDTIMIAPGTYNENVVVNKSVTLQGTGPGVVIEGTFTEDNGNFAGPLSTWLQTAPGYSGASGTGISVSADNVTLKNLTVDDFLTGVDVSGPSVSGLTLDGVTTQHSVNGFSKPDDTALNGATITNSTFQDEYIGAGFFNDAGATGGAGFGKDATDTTITNSHFQDIDIKGVYMETAQGTTLLDGLTMDNVGQYGGVPSFGADGLNGNGIDLNLKYHTYTGNVTVSNFDLTNTGGSAGQSGAIVVEGRDDAPSYSGIPADVSGLNVTIQNGTIDGTSTGIRAGENKANPAQNDTGPAVTIDSVNILNAPQGQIDNHTNSLMTVNGTNGDDTYQSAQTAGSTGPILFYGNGGSDYLLGGLGDDIFVGGTGDDTLDGGTGGIDTANYSDATQDGLIVNLLAGTSSGGGLGNDTLYNIRNLVGSSFNDTLVGDDGDNLLVGGDGNDKLYGHAGNNTLVGGNDTDVAYYSGLETQYSTVNLGSVIGGPDAVSDNLLFVERLKFLSPSHVSDVDNNGTGERIFQNNTTGDLQIQDLGISVSGVGGVNWRAVGTGQFNPDADRQSDVLLQDTATGNLKVITDLTGAQTQTPFSIQPGAAAWKAVAIGDFNGDAASDVLLQNQTTGATEIMFLNTNSTDAVGTVASVAALATPGSGWKAISSGDFNGDGKSDILWQNTTTKAVKVYEMDASTVINTPATQAAAGLTAIGTGDFNGDGNSDILFQNVAGQAVVWFMYGDIHTGTKTVSKPAGTWTVSGAQDVDGNGFSDIIWNNAATDATTATTFGGPASLVSTTVLNPNMGLPTAGNTFHLIASTGGG
jgi:VCBS repeat-containing protein